MVCKVGNTFGLVGTEVISSIVRVDRAEEFCSKKVAVEKTVDKGAVESPLLSAKQIYLTVGDPLPF